MARQHLKKTKSERKGDDRAKQEAGISPEPAPAAVNSLDCGGYERHVAIHCRECVETSGSLQTVALQTANAARSNLKYPSCGDNKGMDVSKRVDMNRPSMHTSLIFLWLVTLCFYVDAKSILFSFLKLTITQFLCMALPSSSSTISNGQAEKHQ